MMIRQPFLIVFQRSPRTSHSCSVMCFIYRIIYCNTHPLKKKLSLIVYHLQSHHTNVAAHITYETTAIGQHSTTHSQHRFHEHLILKHLFLLLKASFHQHCVNTKDRDIKAIQVCVWFIYLTTIW